MVTPRDLVEAQSFARRRVVTAFVTGAAGGRGIDPPGRVRVIVGGALLAVVLTAGAAVSGALAGHDRVDPPPVAHQPSSEQGAGG